MKNNERIVTILSFERLGTSRNGNPHYRFNLDDGTPVRTKIDSMVNYVIPNSEYLNRPVIITTTKAGRVYNVRPAGTPVKFKVGDRVRTKYRGYGDVLEVDHENAAGGGVMNYRLNTGGETHLWYSNDELTLVENEDLPS